MNNFKRSVFLMPLGRERISNGAIQHNEASDKKGLVILLKIQ